MSADTSPPSIVPCVAWYSIHELCFHQNWSQEKEACSNCVMCEIKKGKKCDDFYFTREACWRVYFLSFTPLFVMECKYLKRKGKQVMSQFQLQLFSSSGGFLTFLKVGNGWTDHRMQNQGFNAIWKSIKTVKEIGDPPICLIQANN